MTGLAHKIDESRRSMTGFALTSAEAETIRTAVRELEEFYRKCGHQSTFDLLRELTGKAPTL